MAEDEAVETEWESGQKYTIYSNKQKRWIDIEVVETFRDDEGQWVKIKYEDVVTKIVSNEDFVRDIVSGGNTLKWHHVVEAVKQELYPLIATSLGQSVDELVDSKLLEDDDLTDDAIKQVLGVLKKKKLLYSNEIAYLTKLVERARIFRWRETEDHGDGSSDTLNEFENDKDLNLKWSGLTTNLLIDIYSVHKALMFGQFQLRDYTKTDFLDNIKDAEQRMFKEVVISPAVEQKILSFDLSFHPYYVINDDIFAIMQFHFAVSSLVNHLVQRENVHNELQIWSVVVPKSVTSIYDSEIEHKTNIDFVDEYLNSISSTNPHVCSKLQPIEPNNNVIDSIYASISKMYEMIRYTNPKQVVIVFNRRNGVNNIHLFEYQEIDELKGLYNNYFLGFEFTTRCNTNRQQIARPLRIVRCWMTFGMNERMRFYPETLLWIVPRLFARSDRMAPREMMDRLYGSEYKWGWRVSLDDPTFDRFYHIITQYEHITNNYNRNEMILSKQMASECGLRDRLDHELHQNPSKLIHHFVQEQAFDSDALLQDSLAEKRANDGRNSNIYRLLSASGLHLHFRAFRHSLLRYQGTVCCSENVLSIGECPHIDDVVADMQRLKECQLEIEPSNFWHFDLESIMSSCSHILSVHELLSDDDEHKESKHRILSHILQRVQCGADTECKALRGRRQRRRGKTREERIEMESDPITAECEALKDALFTMHCQIFHGEIEQIRAESKLSRFPARMSITNSMQNSDSDTKQDEESKDDVDIEKVPSAINFGVSVLRWLQHGVSPTFDTLRDELIMHPDSTIDLGFYDRLQRWAAVHSEDSGLTIDESLGLKAYSDTNEFQAALSRAHWDTASEEARRSFYLWAMTLYRVHVRRARPIPPATKSGFKPRPLFTGLNQLLILSQDLAAYYGPLSTTTSKNVASGFSKGKGQIYKFVSSYVNPLRNTLGIPMRTISCYPQEHEVMLYHSILPIQSTTTETDDPNILVNHFLYSLHARNTPIVRKEAFYNRIGVKWTTNWIPLVLSHKLLYQQTKCNQILVIQRLAKELDISFFELVFLLRDAMFLDAACNLRLRKTPKIASELLSQFVYGVSLVDTFNSDGLEYDAFDETMNISSLDSDSFIIPCSSLMDCISDSIGFSVFCRPKDKSFEFVKIDCLVMNRYEIKRNRPLSIEGSLSVRPFEYAKSLSNSDAIAGLGGSVSSVEGFGGSICIACSSDIIISSKGVITTDAFEFYNWDDDDVSEYPGTDRSILEDVDLEIAVNEDKSDDVELSDDDIGTEDVNSDDYSSDIVSTDSDYSYVSDEKDIIDSRVAMSLISEGTLINNGSLICKQLAGQQRGDRSICLVANTVINHGQMWCGSDIDSIRIFCGRFQNTGCIAPVPELIVNSDSDGEVSSLMMDHLMYALSNRPIPIVDLKVFYDTLGIKWTRKWIPNVLAHEMLLKNSKFDDVPIIERLAFELQIRVFKLILVLRSSLFVDKNCTLRVDTDQRSASHLFSPFVFAVTFGETLETDDVVMHSGDIFEIPCQSLMDSIHEVKSLNIFCRAKDGSFDFVPIESVMMNRYEFKRDSTLIVDRAVKVRDGSTQNIECSSDIIISETGAITATVSESMTITDSQTISNVDSQRRRDCVINMVSKGTVTNFGIMKCYVSGEAKWSGSGICIKTAGHIVNKGTMHCESNIGSTRLICNSFVNTGTIYPAPDIILGMRVTEAPNIEQAIWSKNARKIPLTVYDHRGQDHWPDYDFHPRNLLQNDDQKYYCSDGDLDPVGDWIIFRLNGNSIFKPSEVVIKNDDYWGSGIKKIALWMGKDDGNWIKICEDIEGICSELEPKMQRYKLSYEDDTDVMLQSLKGGKNALDSALDQGADLLMVEFLECHGGSYNVLRQFELYGYELLNVNGN